MKKIFIFVTILTSILGIILYVLISKGYFDVKNLENIKIQGQIKLREPEILNSSKIELGKNIFSYNTGDIESNLLKNPYIKSAIVKRKFPNSLTISIAERLEFFYVPYMSSYIILDEEGTALKAIQDVSFVDKPIITGIKIKHFSLGSKVQLKNQRDLKRTIDLLNACNSADIVDDISEIKLDESGNIQMYAINNVRVNLGQVSKFSNRMKMLSKILVDIYKKGLLGGVIDMSYDGYPVYRSN